MFCRCAFFIGLSLITRVALADTPANGAAVHITATPLENLAKANADRPVLSPAMTLSGDANHVAVVHKKGDQAMALDVDGHPGPNFKAIDSTLFHVADDFSKAAYEAQDERGNRFLVIQHADGKAESYPVAGPGNAAPDWRVDPTYDLLKSVHAMRPVLTHSARGRGDVVKVGPDGPEMPKGLLKFDPTGTHYLALALDDTVLPQESVQGTSRGKPSDIPPAVAWLDGRRIFADNPPALRHPAADLIKRTDNENGMVVSPAGTYWFTLLSSNSGTGRSASPAPFSYHTFSNGAEVEILGNHEPTTVVISPDGKRVAYIIRDPQPFVVVDGKQQQDFANIRNLFFTSDSKSVVYLATDTNQQQVVVVDGVKGPSVQANVVLPGPRQGQFVCLSRDSQGNASIVRDGASYTLPADFSFRSDLYFTLDGRHVVGLGIRASALQVFIDGTLTKVDGPAGQGPPEICAVPMMQNSSFSTVLCGKARNEFSLLSVTISVK